MADLALDTFILYMLVGFIAQIADGALGMAYGTISTSVLLASGLPPVTASASVHTAQFFTTGLAGLSHALFRNVNWRLCFTLAGAGIVGGICGAVFLASVDGDAIRPWISGYLLLLGFFILWRTWKQRQNAVWKKSFSDETNDRKARPSPREVMLGVAGGGLDAIGGGGWGPIVTSGLLARGASPRFTIGSVNTAEFFVKTATATAFFVILGFNFGDVVLGLLVGGVLAAPFGAYVLSRIKAEILMGLVGALVVILSLIQLYMIVF